MCKQGPDLLSNGLLYKWKILDTSWIKVEPVDTEELIIKIKN